MRTRSMQLVGCFVALLSVACESPSMPSSIVLASTKHDKGDDSKASEVKKATPTSTATATATSTPIATSTPAPTATATPVPTTPSLFPPTIPGAVNDPDVFQMVAPAGCVFRTQGQYVDVAFVVTGAQGFDGASATVQARFFDLGGVQTASVALGVFPHGTGHAQATWGTATVPAWVALLGTVNGVAYRSDTCAVTTSAY